MRTALLSLFPALLMAGCSGEPARDAAAPSANASAQTTAEPPAPPPVPVPVPANARSVSVANDLYEFDYSYPAAAASIPGLKAWLDADLDKRKAGLIADARAGQQAAKKDGFPYHPYSLGLNWKVVTDLPGWLSLSTIVGTYTGGAHPNYGFQSLVWDRSTGTRHAPEDLFTSKAALSAAIRKPFCAELDRQRAKKREGQPIGDGIPEFSGCIDPVAETVILGSTHAKAFNRIGVLVAPYSAGPYAEGDYDVTVPVTDAVLQAVKPEYRPLFSVR